MKTNRLGTGTTIAAFAAIVLLFAMFFAWFELEGISAEGTFGEVVPGGDIEPGAAALQATAQEAIEDSSATPWEAFGFIDIVLAGAIAAVLGLAAAKASDSAARSPVSLSTVVGALGLLAAVLVLYRIISLPDLVPVDGGAVEIETEVGREPWLFVGFVAAAAIAYGGWRAMQEEGAAA